MIANPATCVVSAMAEMYKNKSADPMDIIGVFISDAVWTNMFFDKTISKNPNSSTCVESVGTPEYACWPQLAL